MKLLTLLLTLTCAGASQPVPNVPPNTKKEERLEQNFTPEVQLFITRCMDDKEHKYANAHAWLKKSGVVQPDKDQMTEVLSGLVWNIDKERARKIALEIVNKKRQKALLQYYDKLEQLPPPPVKEG